MDKPARLSLYRGKTGFGSGILFFLIISPQNRSGLLEAANILAI
jgi:hypothetical protein